MSVTQEELIQDSNQSLLVQVISDRCAGCQECVVRCPTGALSMNPATWTAVADNALCVGCRQCVRTCPFSAITVKGPLATAPRLTLEVRPPATLRGDLTETRPGISSWPAALAEASRCLTCPDPTCVRGCPTHNDIPAFIAAIRNADLDEAHQVLSRTSCLPDVCSRVCDQAVQCEGACTWSLAGGTPVAIGALERFVADNAPTPAPAQKSGSRTELDVAIVGSGPAAIGAAWRLVEAGAKVTVFEKDRFPGGLLRSGIPDFTLPQAVARRPWEALIAAGVELKCEHGVSADEIMELPKRFDAVLLAHGAGLPLRLPVKGADLDGVWDASRFLEEGRNALVEKKPLPVLAPAPSADAPTPTQPPTVLVIGGGNTAMDTARIARRLGANAICVDWLDRKFAPVRPDELEEAEREGVEVRFSTTVERIEGFGGRVQRVLLARTEQRRPDRLPKVLNQEPVPVDVTLVVMAMGYRVEPGISAKLPGVPVARRQSGLVDRRWQGSGIMAAGSPQFARHQPVGQLSLGRDVARNRAAFALSERIWVAGDALVGPSTVVEAMAQGRCAADAIIAHQPSVKAVRKGAAEGNVLVTYESRGGNTRSIAEKVASIITGTGATTTVLPIRDVTVEQMAAADLVVLGTWVEGTVIARVAPAKAATAWIRALPHMEGKKFGLFCTYGVAPRDALSAMAGMVGQCGAEVVAQASFHPRRCKDAELESFAEKLVSSTFAPKDTGARKG